MILVCDVTLQANVTKTQVTLWVTAAQSTLNILI